MQLDEVVFVPQCTTFKYSLMVTVGEMACGADISTLLNFHFALGFGCIIRA